MITLEQAKSINQATVDAFQAEIEALHKERDALKQALEVSTAPLKAKIKALRNEIETLEGIEERRAAPFKAKIEALKDRIDGREFRKDDAEYIIKKREKAATMSLVDFVYEEWQFPPDTEIVEKFKGEPDGPGGETLTYYRVKGCDLIFYWTKDGPCTLTEETLAADYARWAKEHGRARLFR